MNGLIRLAPANIADSSRTLRELVPRFLRWFEFVRLRRPNTVQNYGHDLRAFLAFCERAELSTPDQLTFRHVEFWMGLMQQEGGLAPRSCNRHLHSLRAFWRWLRREGATATDPTADVSPLPVQKTLPGYLTVPEQEKVLTALSRESTWLARRDYALVATALLTGLRCSELANLQVAHVDLEAGRLRVVEGKGQKDRELPIIPRLDAVLRGYLEGVRPQLVGRPVGKKPPPSTQYVFVNAHHTGAQRLRRAGQSLLGRTIFSLVRRAVAPIIGRPVHPHMLRHSFASRLRENGADLQLIQEALGHASITTTTMYAHLTTNKRRQELARLLD